MRFSPQRWTWSTATAIVIASAPVVVPSSPAGATPSLAPVSAQLGPTLFRAIATDNVALARTLFFPASAYLAMKTGMLAYPGSDYTNRLLAFYTLDLAAYHQLLVSGGPAHYQRTLVDPGLATWIAPGVCENRIGYWHEPPIRLVYTQRGVTKSFAVDSLITWHNHYYVIHLGPNPRPSNVGTVDRPQLGPGAPGPAGGC
jgi:hypothetical protein